LKVILVLIRRQLHLILRARISTTAQQAYLLKQGKTTKPQPINGIKGNATILYWIKQSQGLNGYDKKAIVIANFAEMKKNIHDKKLEEENKELKELLRVAELRADLWQHAIEIAEKKFNIDILKKYGAQQSTPSKSNDQKKK